MTKNEQLEPRLEELLDELKPVPLRDPQAAAHARSRFLAQAISAGEVQRHSMWTIFQRKEQFAMNLVVSTLLVLGLLFGGRAVVSAAQDDLPQDPLYPVKLVSEDASLWLEPDPAMKVEMLMQQAQRRTDEMAEMVSEGVPPPVEQTIRLQERIRLALQLAIASDDPEMTEALEQIRTRLQTQERLMIQLQDGSCMQCEPVLQQTREMLQQQLRTAENGLSGPAAIRNQNQTQSQHQGRTPQTSPTTDKPATPQGTGSPALDGGGQQIGSDNPFIGTPVPPNNNGNGNGPGNDRGRGGNP
jgi:hypothetical protein